MPKQCEIREILDEAKAALKKAINDASLPTGEIFDNTDVPQIVEDILIDLWTALKPEAKAHPGMQSLITAFAAIELKHEQVR